VPKYVVLSADKKVICEAETLEKLATLFLVLFWRIPPPQYQIYERYDLL
jgi:hypothetical protein